MRKVKKPKWERAKHTSNKHLDWDKLLDGNCYIIKHGTGPNDFHSHPLNFVISARQLAKRRGLRLNVSLNPEKIDEVQLQAE